MAFLKVHLHTPTLLFLAHCLMAAYSTTAMASTNLTTDKSALLALKSHLTINNSHVISRNWSASPVCSWVGVTCSSRHQRVSGIDISGMELAGNFPPEIGNLTFLMWLNVSNNRFHGGLPQELARLKRLDAVDLSFNNFSGDFPSWIGSWVQLRSFNCSSNGLSGILSNSIGNLSNLETLDLSDTSLHGPIPPELGNLPKLRRLNLGSNQFNGYIPASLFNLSTIETIDLTGNTISGELPDDICGGITRLTALYLSDNELGGPIPTNISGCTQLRFLSLSRNRFSGSIPRGIGNLGALETLYVGSNDLNGEIPDDLGRLQKLTALSIGNNSFTGSIPPTIFNISSLQLINIANCSLSGSIPHHICTPSSQLQHLHLHYNQLVGELPQGIGLCSSLRIVSLSFNNITGDIPRGIGNLTALQYFYVANNNLIGSIPKEIGKLQNLIGLQLRSNSLTGSIPSEISNMSNLWLFQISSNEVSGYLPSNFGYGLANLEELYLNENLFIGEIPRSISNASNLQRLYLTSNRFHGLVPDSIGALRFLQVLSFVDNNFVSDTRELSFITPLTNCRHLIRLGFAGNPFNGILPASVGNLSKSLQFLHAYNCGLEGRIPEDFANLTNLLVVSLFGNQLTGSSLEVVMNLPLLQGVDLSQNRLSGAIPEKLCGLTSLNSLWIYQNQIPGAIPDCIGNLTSLRSLYLGHNILDSCIPSSLWHLNDLNELNTSSNSLTCSLSPDIGNLRTATLVDLSMNQISGTIPATIGNMRSLISLSLSHNGFEGAIPGSIGELVSIEALNFSHNRLSGNIPESVESLRYLVSFDVSFNELSGKIPSGGPFANFPSESFVSNKGLCGDPRFRVSPCPNTSVGRSNRRKRVLIVIYAVVGIAAFFLILALAYSFIRNRNRKTIPAENDLQSGKTLLRTSYYEILQATDRLSESHLLGSGGFGSVFKGTLQNGEVVAIKVFNLQSEGAYKSFETECEVLRSLRHRNLCKVISACSNEDFKALVLEYMPNGSLDKWLHSEDHSLKLMQRVNLMIDVACALEYLHHGYTIPVIHCDVKPSNVLLDQEMVGHLSDFGVSKLLGEGHHFVKTSTFPTLGYIAPEYGSEGLVSTKCDIYSYGIMLMEVFTKMKPSSEKFIGDFTLRRWVEDCVPKAAVSVVDRELLNTNEGHFTETVECLTSILELALNCCKGNPNERMSMENVVTDMKKIKLRLDILAPFSRQDIVAF